MPAVFCFCLAEWDSAELPATGFSKVRKIEPAGKAGVLGKGNGGSGKVHTEKPLKNNGQKLIKKLFFVNGTARIYFAAVAVRDAMALPAAACSIFERGRSLRVVSLWRMNSCTLLSFGTALTGNSARARFL